jgi:phage terminase large subunit GpA-like protein
LSDEFVYVILGKLVEALRPGLYDLERRRRRVVRIARGRPVIRFERKIE